MMDKRDCLKGGLSGLDYLAFTPDARLFQALDGRS